MKPPTLEDFLRHAKRFGPEEVYETARDYLGDSQLVVLRQGLQEAKPGYKLPAGELERLVLWLDADGHPSLAVAARLRVSVKQVERILKKVRELEPA